MELDELQDEEAAIMASAALDFFFVNRLYMWLESKNFTGEEILDCLRTICS